MQRRLLPLAAAALVALPLMAGAASAEPDQPPRVTVTGHGNAAVSPDMAILTLSVVRRAETAGDALGANSEAMSAVIAALKKDGVDSRDLQTSGLSIQPVYVYDKKDDGTQVQRLAGYEVINTLTVRVRDLASVGGIIDQSVSLGVNQGGDVVFTNADPSKTVTEARKKAVADAIARARTLTEAAGIGLGRILEMSEQGYDSGPVPIKARMAADAVPIEAGENTYQVDVTVTFELGPKQ